MRLAVLGACNGATRDAGGSWTGVAPALVKEKIPAVVAMQFKVGDRAAISFMLTFYARVLDGYPVDQAVSEARRQIYRNPGPQGDWATIRDWGTPVLYLRSPDGILFPEPEELSMGTGPEGQPVVNAHAKVRRVAGKLENVKIGEMVEGIVNATLNIDEIAENAEVTNVTIDFLGGRRKNP